MIGIQSFMCGKLAWNSYKDATFYLNVCQEIFKVNLLDGYMNEYKEFIKIYNKENK
jgi:hypothetical protein